MIIEIKDITHEMKVLAVAKAPPGATCYHFRSGKYYTKIGDFDCEYVDEIKGFAVSMNTTDPDIRLRFKQVSIPQIDILDGCIRSVHNNGDLHWLPVGKPFVDALMSAKNVRSGQTNKIIV